MSDQKSETACFYTATVTVSPLGDGNVEKKNVATKIDGSTYDPIAESDRGDAPPPSKVPDFDIYEGIVEDAMNFSHQVEPISLENRPKVPPSSVLVENEDEVFVGKVSADNKVEELFTDPRFLSSVAFTEDDKKMVSKEYAKFVETPSVQLALKKSDFLIRPLLKKYFPEDADFPTREPSITHSHRKSSSDETLEGKDLCPSSSSCKHIQFLTEFTKKRRENRRRSMYNYFLNQQSHRSSKISKINLRPASTTLLFKNDSRILRDNSLDDLDELELRLWSKKRRYKSCESIISSASSIIGTASVHRYLFANGNGTDDRAQLFGYVRTCLRRNRPDFNQVNAGNICDIVLYEHVVLVNFINLFYGYTGMHVVKRRPARAYLMHVLMYSFCLFVCCFSSHFWN